ncbi:hypothetical protein ACVTMO_12320 [Pseudomonas segetis]
MRMGRYHWIYAFLAVLFSFGAHAADYSFIVSPYPPQASALAACQQFKQDSSYNYTNARVASTSNPIVFNCYYTRTKYIDPGKGTVWENIQAKNVTRSGDGCPSGSIYDPALGYCQFPSADAGQVCDPAKDPNDGFPKITNTAGECVRFSALDQPATCKYLSSTAGTGAFKAFVKFDSDGEPYAPDIQKFGCAVEAVVAASCKMPAAKSSGGVSLAPAGKVCMIAAVYTGEVATDAGGGYTPVGDPDGDVEGICPPDTDCEGPDLPSVEEKKPCNYVYGEFGIQSCTSSEFKGDPGSMNCGTVNGGPYTCTAKVPTSNGIQIGTTVKTTDNGDGTTTVTKTDKIDQVKCQGAGSCVTNTTTSVSTTIKNGNGETISQNGQCTGPACSDSTGKGDGDGDGIKDCALGKECDEEDKEIGKQDFFTPGDDTIESVFADFTDKIKESPIATAGSDFFSIPSGGSCPQWHAQVWEFQIDLDQICTTDIPWGAIRAIILAMASFVAFRWALL